MAKTYYSHYLPIGSNKQAQCKYRTKEEKDKLSTDYDSVKGLDSVAGLLAGNAVCFDFDANVKISVERLSDILKAMIDGENVDCRMSISKGTHGGIHVTILNDGSITKNYTGVTLACGLVADIKCGGKNSYEILKINGVEYPVLKNTLGTMPKYFKPIKNGVDFSTIGKGDRTNAIGGWVRRLCGKEGFTADEAFKCAEIINKYVLAESIPDDELKAQVLNQSTYEKCENDYKTGDKKGELTIAAFNEYVKSLGISVKYNELTKRADIENVPAKWKSYTDFTNILPILMLDELKLKYKNLNKAIVADNLCVFADENRFNPIHEYFTAVKWDGKKRIHVIAQEVLNIADDFLQGLVEKWLVQCVAMSFNNLEKPIQLEGVLILCGTEGIGKSRFFRALCPKANWFRAITNAISVSNKDDKISAIGGWIVEICEIDSTLQRKSSELKAFITNDVDVLRKPFGREEVDIPRTTCFCGTTNSYGFLNDESGYRRFWCVDVEKINLKPLENADFLAQLWAECYTIWAKNENFFRLSDSERIELRRRNEGKTEEVPAQDELMMTLDFDAPKDKWIWAQASAIKQMPAYGVGHYSPVVIGRALRAIERLNTGVKFRKRNGINGYIIPPIKYNRDEYGNKM